MDTDELKELIIEYINNKQKEEEIEKDIEALDHSYHILSDNDINIKRNKLYDEIGDITNIIIKQEDLIKNNLIKISEKIIDKL